jgi:hypothetical protein
MSRICLGLLALLLASTVLSAQPNKNFTVQQWSGGPQYNAKGKQFERCAASMKNDAGVAVAYSVDRSFNWQLGLSNPAWDFVPGHKIRLSINSGDDDFRDLLASATTNRILAIEVNDPIALFDRLRTNRSMRVQAGGLRWDFPAIEGNEVMAALVVCVLQQGSRPARSTSAATNSEKPLQLTPSSDPRNESKAIMAGLLSQINLTGVQYVRPSNVFPVGRTDSAWRKETITGTLTVVPGRKFDQQTIGRDLLNDAAQPCRGQLFVIATSGTVDGTPMARAFVSCRDFVDVVSAYYFAIPRAAGGYYQVGTIKSGFEVGPLRIAEDLDLKIRSVVVGVVARHGAPAEQ